MTLEFADLAAGMRLSGVEADVNVTVVAVDIHGPNSATLTYRTTDGRLGERIVFADDLANLAEASERRWSFDADGSPCSGLPRRPAACSRPIWLTRSPRWTRPT